MAEPRYWMTLEEHESGETSKTPEEGNEARQDIYGHPTGWKHLIV